MAGVVAVMNRIWRPVLSAIAVFAAVGVTGVFLFRAVPDAPTVDCDVVRRSDERASRAALLPALQDRLGVERQVYDRALVALDAAGAAQRERLDEVTLQLETEQASRAEVGDQSDGGRVADLEQRRDELLVEIESLTADGRRTLWAAVGNLHSTMDRLADLYRQSEQEQDAFELVDEGAAVLDELEAMLLADLAAVPYEQPSSQVVAAPVTLQPSASAFTIPLGSSRSTRRVEILLEVPASGGLTDGGRVQVGDEAVIGDVGLPDQATYESIAGQFREDRAGREIQPESITVWARRVGPAVLLNVCIDPDDDLTAGSYVGDVHLVDPSLNSVRVPVTVTAQFKWIDLLYLALVVFPFLAMFYVWYTAGALVTGSPWDLEAFKRWAGPRFLVLFGVGFAAVWATLQVAFNNPTWGESLIGSAALIGGGLAAAATAMTAIATVRLPGSGQPAGAGQVESSPSAEGAETAP